jgi:succinyl-CoA synthetase beta subunit
LVNIFGGIMKCDVIAEGIVEVKKYGGFRSTHVFFATLTSHSRFVCFARQAAKNVGLNVPLVVRLEGTNVDMGVKILQDSGLPIITATNLDDAAEKAVAAIA